MKNKMTVMGQGFAHPENHSSDIKELSFAELLPISHIKVGGLSSSVVCSGQLKLATVLEFFRYWFSDSFGGNP
ncbi:hypothetical protein AB7W26_10575, partial [Providencia rettgeri]